MSQLRIIFKITNSPPNRYSDCFEIADGKLTVKCRLPGLEIDILCFLIEALKLNVYWIPVTSGKTSYYGALENGYADIIGNLKGPDNTLKYNISAVTVSHMYETTAYMLRPPEPTFYKTEAVFLMPYKPMVWFAMIVSICAVSVLSGLAHKLTSPSTRFKGLFKMLRLVLGQLETEIFVGRCFSKAFTTIMVFCCLIFHKSYEQKIMNQIMIGKMRLKTFMRTEDFADFMFHHNHSFITDSEKHAKRLVDNSFYQRNGFKRITDRHRFTLEATDSPMDILDRMRNSDVSYVFPTNSKKAAFFRQTYQDIYAVTPTDDAFEYDGYLFSKAAPTELKERFGRAINEYSTIISRILSRYFQARESDITAVAWMSSLKLERIRGIFALAITGLSTAAFAFVVELATAFINHRKKATWVLIPDTTTERPLRTFLDTTALWF